MKKLVMFFIGLLMCISFTSCSISTYATTQDDMYIDAEIDVVKSDVDYNVVIRYGTPYYYNGNILYYIYNNLYYYPYFYNDYWYFRVYRRPFVYTHYHPYFRPHRYDYRFNRGYRQPHNWYRYTPGHRTIPNTYSPNRTRPNTTPHTYQGRPSGVRPNTSYPNRTTRPNINRTLPSSRSSHQMSRGGSFRGGRR